MTDNVALHHVNQIFGNVRRMVGDSFQMPRHMHDLQIGLGDERQEFASKNELSAL